MAGRRDGIAARAPQLRDGEGQPFGMLEGYVPMGGGDGQVYRAIREALPIIDVAIVKLIRLVGGCGVVCADRAGQAGLDRFLSTVVTGRGQRGLQSFLECYLDSLLVHGRAVGEIVLDRQGRDIGAVLCGNVDEVVIREGEHPLDFALCARQKNGEAEPLPYQDLLLYTPFRPEAEHPYGVSLLRSMPFITGILLKIYQAIGVNWERMGNVRFAVVCKPTEGMDANQAQERCRQVAQEWSAAMEAGKRGSVRDFVAVGDVEIKVIGADNPVLDSEIPVRQMLEQLVAATGIPPFLLGLSWASTERMSAQQVDMLTSEITAIRRSIAPVVERICELWLRLHGYEDWVTVEWEDINLQDLVEESRAALYQAQAEKLREGK